jgi:hypothetical protein
MRQRKAFERIAHHVVGGVDQLLHDSAPEPDARPHVDSAITGGAGIQAMGKFSALHASTGPMIVKKNGAQSGRLVKRIRATNAPGGFARHSH